MQMRRFVRSPGAGLLDAATLHATPAASGNDAAVVAVAISDDAISRLERLARLKDQGVLTEHELEAQKRALLRA
jgi:hypothetical protein